jgi:hypothetical protein
MRLDFTFGIISSEFSVLQNHLDAQNFARLVFTFGIILEFHEMKFSPFGII